jgi:Fe-S cluster assembly protein SufD
MLNQNTIRTLSANLEEPEWLLSKRMKSLDSFANLEQPSFKYGIGISMDISDLKMDKINPLKSSNKTIIKNPKEVEVLHFTNALKKHQDLIKEHFMTKIVAPEENKFTALHGAFFDTAILIRIPENANPKEYIEIKSDLTSETKIEHILVIAEKNSNATILETSSSLKSNEQVFRSQIVEVIVKENANIEYISAQNFSKSVHNFCTKKAHVEKNGSINWMDCQIGGKFTQNIMSTNLYGLGSSSKNYGVIFGDEQQRFDIKNTTEHHFSETISDMATRVVLNDSSKAIYRGLVKINPGAINCEGYQKDDTILLSDNAEADVVPNLEISNNEVKCSHGATVSQVDEDKLFYLTSRGLDEKTAKILIIEGFFHPIIDKLSDSKIKEDIINSISERLKAI